MFIGNPGILAFGSGGPFRQDAFERDIAVISAMYYDRGFLAVQVSTPRVMLTPDRTGIEIAITIDEGPRYKIRQLRIYERGEGGKEVEPIGGRRNLRMMVRAKSGDYFNRAALLEDLQAIRTLYRDHGYANVDANPQTQLDPATSEVDVIVPVERGPLVHFERIEMRGNGKTRDKVIRRELEVYEGGQFHETKLERSKRRVTALGYFERVDISMEQGSAPDKMNVYIEVAERRLARFRWAPVFRASRTSSPPRRFSRPTCSATGRACHCRVSFRACGSWSTSTSSSPISSTASSTPRSICTISSATTVTLRRPAWAAA